MTTLHKAALKRAYRTLAQGLAGSTVATAIATTVSAFVIDGEPASVALISAASALGTTVLAAFTSFWQGVAMGLPEAE